MIDNKNNSFEVYVDKYHMQSTQEEINFNHSSLTKLFVT